MEFVANSDNMVSFNSSQPLLSVKLLYNSTTSSLSRASRILGNISAILDFESVSKSESPMTTQQNLEKLKHTLVTTQRQKGSETFILL